MSVNESEAHKIISACACNKNPNLRVMNRCWPVSLTVNYYYYFLPLVYYLLLLLLLLKKQRL